MKTVRFMMAALLSLTGWVSAETVSVVQVVDMRGQIEYQVLNREEFKTLQKEIRDETAAFTAVVAECKKEWEADKDKKIAFQGTRVKPRAARSTMDFTDRAKADKKRSQLQDRFDAKQSEEVTREGKKRKSARTEDVAKEEARAKAVEDAFSMISKKLGDKLGRPVPSFGFQSADVKREEPKKEAKKEEPKKEEKKVKK